MAQSVKPTRMCVHVCLGVCLGVLWAPIVSLAQHLPDPTRPPSSISRGDTSVVEVSVPVLQSILISPQRKFAIIDGQTIALYGKFGHQTLVHIGETEVVLKSGKQLQTLRLHPDLIKKQNRHVAKSP